VAIGLGFQRETSGASRSLYGDGIRGVGVTIEPDSFSRCSSEMTCGTHHQEKKKGKDGSRWAASAGRFAARVRQMGCTFPLHLLNLQIKSNKFVRIRIVI
jgi:hypothetical protein